MQAGESLNFIQPFTGTEHRSIDPNDNISDEDVVVLSLILKKFINENTDNVHSFDVLEESGFVTVFEASYRLDMRDGSYLHIVVYGSQIDAGLLDFGVSINEHLDDGVYNGGMSILMTKMGSGDLHRLQMIYRIRRKKLTRVSMMTSLIIVKFILWCRTCMLGGMN